MLLGCMFCSVISSDVREKAYVEVMLEVESYVKIQLEKSVVDFGRLTYGDKIEVKLNACVTNNSDRDVEISVFTSNPGPDDELRLNHVSAPEQLVIYKVVLENNKFYSNKQQLKHSEKKVVKVMNKDEHCSTGYNMAFVFSIDLSSRGGNDQVVSGIHKDLLEIVVEVQALPQ